MGEYELVKQQLDTFIRETNRRLNSLEEAEKKSVESMGVIKTAIELIKQATGQTNDSITRIEETLKENLDKISDRITCIEKEPTESYRKYKTAIVTILITAPLTAMVTAIVSLVIK